VSAFFSPSPALETDPALTARTFSNNPTLSAALQRIAERTNNVPPLPERAFDYLIQFKTESDCSTEGYRVCASDILTAIAEAHRQATPKHPNTTLRVVSAQELNGRGAA
jgi:hypothetical protein